MKGQAKKMLKKMVVVVFLTLMIWVWADLETEEPITITGIPLRIAKSPDPALRVDFIQSVDRLGAEIRINSISLKGPSSRIQEIRRMEEDGTLDLQLSLVPEAESIAAPSDKPRESRVWSVLSFLRRSPVLRKYGVSVDKCDPASVDLLVRRFAPRSLEVRCEDENNMRLPNAVCDPPRIEMYVPEDWARQIAWVHLTTQEYSRARAAAIAKRPYIEDFGQQSFASKEVRVSITEQEKVLKAGAIGGLVRLGILGNPIVLSKYKVEITNLTKVLEPFEFEATDEAKLAYEKMAYHVILVISKEATGVQKQELLYWFPPEYEGKGEIRLISAPQTAEFELVPRAAPESSTPTPD